MLFLTPSQQCHSTEGKFSFGTTTTAVLRPFFRDHPGEPVPEENLWTLRCKGRLTPTIPLGATPSGLSGAHFSTIPPSFAGRMPFLPPNQQCQSTEGKWNRWSKKTAGVPPDSGSPEKIAIKARYTLPVSTHGLWHKRHFLTLVFTDRVHGAWTRVVCAELKGDMQRFFTKLMKK